MADRAALLASLRAEWQGLITGVREGASEVQKRCSQLEAHNRTLRAQLCAKPPGSSAPRPPLPPASTRAPAAALQSRPEVYTPEPLNPEP